MRTAPHLALLWLVALPACATTRGATQDQPLPPGVYDVRAQVRLSDEALVARLDPARFVVIGERHTDAFDHRVQARLYAALQARRRGAVALGMEMFRRPAQPALDAYVAGQHDEAALLQRVRWEKTWGFPPALYAPLWRAARERKHPVVALNIRRGITRKVSRGGLDSLSAEERALVPATLDLTNSAHRAWFRDIFAAHGMKTGEEALTRFYTAQVIWDETMAQTAARFMAQRPAQDVMVIIAGAGHVLRGYGIPSRLRRRTRASAGSGVAPVIITIIPASRASAKAGRHTRRDLARWHDERYADYVVVE